MEDRYVVYILASRRYGTLYIGVTGSFEQRIEQHKSGAVPGFTQRYGMMILVYDERFSDVREALAREKQLKGWNRAWKLKLIEAANPSWQDLGVDRTRRSSRPAEGLDPLPGPSGRRG